MSQYIKWFKELTLDDVELVGGKNASLGEMYQNLTTKGIRIPNGFAVTSDAYRYVLQNNDVWHRLHAQLDGFIPEDVTELQKIGKICRDIIHTMILPDDLKAEIATGYQLLKEEYGENVTLAVRSSATAEDSPEASFAGQNDTYLNIGTLDALFDAYIRCLASNFTDRSIHYKYVNGFDFLKVHLSVVVMKMVRSDIATSGVMFSIDTETGFKDVIFINATYGLGETVVQGSVAPDNYYVHKPTFKKGYRSVLKRKLGEKAIQMVFSEEINKNNIAHEYTKTIQTPIEAQKQFCMCNTEVITLAEYAMKIEDYYSKKIGQHKPMDMEWAKDGLDGHLYIVQARPETIESKKEENTLEMYLLNDHSKVLISGRAVGMKIGTGKVRKIIDTSQLDQFQTGDILVSETTSPDWEPVMKRASAIITNSGGRTCHAAIVSRELGIPAIVGTKNAFEVLKDGQQVTVSCAEGETGIVYEGILAFEVKKNNLSAVPKTQTKIMMNLGNPDLAFSLASLPVDGIGLARMEFIINTAIKAHPMALIYPEKTNINIQHALDELTFAYKSNKDFFIQTLSEGVASIASSVYPNPCVVRMSDFKSNEYASLLGGSYFEPEESNPMIGFRGAARYSHPSYEEGFALECMAMKRVREEMGFDNVILMIPFCRRVKEAKKVLETMAKYGLKREENNLQIYVMCEIPNNVIEIDAFSKLFDGFSIGSNDLTQLTLGVDRDSEIVAFEYDERDPGVMKIIEMAVEGAKRNNRYSGICGQGPSDFPEMAEALVKLGIDSISLNPDSVLQTIENISQFELTMKKK